MFFLFLLWIWLHKDILILLSWFYTEFTVKIAEIAENKIKIFTKIFWVGPFLEDRSGKGKQAIYSSQPY